MARYRRLWETLAITMMAMGFILVYTWDSDDSTTTHYNLIGYIVGIAGVLILISEESAR